MPCLLAGRTPTVIVTPNAFSAAQADDTLTTALACWTATLWQAGARSPEASSPHFYLDGHRKPVYSQTLIPRGLIGRSGKILGCRTLVLLHDEQGHPLLAITHRGDMHLTTGIPSMLTRYEHVIEALHLTNLVVDREAMAAEFLAQLKAQGRALTTILKTNQYTGLDSFSNIGAFVPLTVDRQGTVLREVAPAQFLLARPEQNEEPLKLAVVLIRRSFPISIAVEQERDGLYAWWVAGLKGLASTPLEAAQTAVKEAFAVQARIVKEEQAYELEQMRGLLQECSTMLEDEL